MSSLRNALWIAAWTFSPALLVAQEQPRRMLYVLAPNVKVLSGQTTVGTVESGMRFLIEGTNGRHYLIWLDNDGKKQGWVPADQVLLEPPLSLEQWKRVNAAGDQRGIAWNLHQKGKSKEALPILQSSLKVYQELLGAEHPGVAAVLGEIGDVQLAVRDFPAATAAHKQAVAVAEKAFGVNHPRATSARRDLSRVYFDAGQYEPAEALVRRNLEVSEAVNGKDHLDTAQLANDLGVVISLLGRHREVGELYHRCLSIREARLPKDDPAIADILSSLGSHYAVIGKPTEAEAYLLRGVRISEAKDKNSLDVANLLNNLAHLYSDLGRYSEAETTYRRSLAIREAKHGKNHPDVAHSLNNLAAMYQRQGKHGEAELLHRRALAVREATLGKDHPQTGSSLHNLAVIYQELGRPEDAEPLYKRLLVIQESKLGKNHPITAVTLSNLAGLYSSQGKHAEAEKLLGRTLEIRKSALGGDHAEVAAGLTEQGVLAKDQGKPLEEIEPLFKQALAIRESKLGPNHPDTAASLRNLGSLYTDMGRQNDAESFLRRSLKIYETALGIDDPATASVLQSLGWLYATNERRDLARPVYDQSRRAARSYVTGLLPTLSAEQQASYLHNNYSFAFSRALSLGLAYGAADPRIADASAAWLANGKGVQHEAQALAAQLQSLDTPEAKPIAEELRKVRLAHTALRAQPAKAGLEESRANELAELETRDRELANRLQKLGGRTGKGKGWTELDQIRSGLPTGGVLIDFVRMLVTDFNTQAAEQVHYAAWITPKIGLVRIVDLGPERELNPLFEAFHADLTGAVAKIQQTGEEEAEKALREKSQALRTRLIDPLLKIAEVKAAKHWVVGPDAGLWLVPWSAIPLANGKYLVEEFSVRLVNAGRDAAFDVAATAPKTSAPLILADPDFDLGRPKAAQLTRQITGSKSADEPQRSLLSGDLLLGRIQRLPATATEAALIAEPIGALAKTPPRVYAGDQALEAVVKATRNPRLLSFSTHGFFLNEQAVRVEPGNETRGIPGAVGIGSPGGGDRPVVTKEGRSYESPLLRCGLLLAACNDQPAAGQTRPGEDGVLTGMEVIALDLRGCEMVVLSACETGLGRISSGEGVAGLRQAFQLAGADSVLASLWSVPDRETALLMVNYFRELASGKDRPTSLAAAQRSLIDKRREKRGAAHPYFWAAFCLTGRDLAVSGELPSAELYTERGRRMMSVQAYDQALADFDEALKLDPKAARAMHNRGMIFKNRNQLDEALAAYDKSIELDDKIPVFYRNRAELYRRRKEYPRAIADLDRAVALDETVDSLLDRAFVHRLTPNLDVAKADMEEAVRRFPDSGRAYTEQGIQAQNANRTDDAIASFTKALELEPQRTSALLNRGKQHLVKKDFPKARADFETVLIYSPDDRGAMEELARLKDTLGDYTGALADWKKLAELDPKWYRPRWEMGARLYLLGKYAEAAEHVDAVVALNPEFDAYSVRAGIRLEKGDLDGAEADAAKALSMSRYAFAYVQLGKIKIARKQPAEALDALNKSLELNAKFIPAYEARIKAHRLAGDEAAAVADEAKLKELQTPVK